MLLKISYICFITFIAASFFSPTLRSIFLVSGLILWLATCLVKLKQGLKRPELSYLDLFFIAFILVNLVLTLIHGVSIVSWLKSFFTTYLQWFWAAYLLTQKIPIINYRLLARTSDFIVLTIIGSASTLSLIIISQLIGLVPHDPHSYGILSQPFTSSGLLLIALFIGLAYREKLSQRLLLTLLLLLQALAIIALGQLSTWFGLVIGILVYAILTKKLTLKRCLIIAVTLSLSLFAITLLSPRVAKKIQRLSSVDHIINSNSMQLRFHLWQQNYNAWLEKPVTGINKVIPYENLTHAHNIYFQQLVEGGLIKFIVWLSFYLAIGFYLVKNIGQGLAAYLVAYLAISIEGLLENWWGDAEVLSLFLIIVILARNHVEEKQVK